MASIGSVSRAEMTSSMSPYSTASAAVMMKSRSVSLDDPLGALAGVVGEHAVEQVPHPQDLPGLELDVAGLALDAAEGLVEEDPGVGQGEPLALGARRRAARRRPRRPGRSRTSTCPA